MPFDPSKPIVMCRSAEPPQRIEPRYILGYSCCICAKPLQVSPHSASVMKASANGVCNPCGTAFMERLRQEPSADLTIQFQPPASDRIEQATGMSMFELFPNAEVRPAEYPD